MFDKPPSTTLISRDALLEWTKLNPINVIDISDTYKVKVDENYLVATLTKKDVFEYIG